jgi:hypothetical protein
MSGWKVEFLEVARDEFVDWPDELKASLIRIFDRIEALGLDRVREPMVKHISRAGFGKCAHPAGTWRVGRFMWR